MTGRPTIVDQREARLMIEDLSTSPPRREVHIAGRVLAVNRGSRPGFSLADSSGTVVVNMVGADLPDAGDHVRVSGVAGERGFAARKITRLTPCRSSRPFPSPGGEYYRLHQAPAARIDTLRLRARCLAAIRSFFDDRDYLEVQTPLRVRSPGLEPHLTAEVAGDRYLITSPEYHMKRLLAGGLERIYSMGPCWRGDEVGRHHLGEFCMLEWYQAHGSIEELMVQTEELVARVASRTCGLVTRGGKDLDLRPPFRRQDVAGAFVQHAGVDIAGIVDAPQLRRRAEAAGYGPFEPGEAFEDIFSRIMVERVEPALAGLGPTFLTDFPAPLAALSRLREDDPSIAERFELYIGGLELANAFGELTDPAEQLCRLESDQRARRSAGRAIYPIDRRFIRALEEGIPPATGIALGVDRLVMLCSGAEDISEVVAFAPAEV